MFALTLTFRDFSLYADTDTNAIAAVVIGIVHTTARVDDTRTKTAVMVVEAVSATRGMSAEVKMKSTTTRAVGYTHVYGYV